MSSTHRHLRKQQTEREQRETWVRGCPHDLLCWDKRRKTAASLQASHQLWGVCVCVCVCGWYVRLCVLLGKGLDPGSLHKAINLYVGGSLGLYHTQLFTPPLQDPPLFFIWSSRPWMCALRLTAATKIRAHQGRAAWEAVTPRNAPLFTC